MEVVMSLWRQSLPAETLWPAGKAPSKEVAESQSAIILTPKGESHRALQL